MCQLTNILLNGGLRSSSQKLFLPAASEPKITFWSDSPWNTPQHTIPSMYGHPWMWRPEAEVKNQPSFSISFIHWEVGSLNQTQNSLMWLLSLVLLASLLRISPVSATPSGHLFGFWGSKHQFSCLALMHRNQNHVLQMVRVKEGRRKEANRLLSGVATRKVSYW